MAPLPVLASSADFKALRYLGNRSTKDEGGGGALFFFLFFFYEFYLAHLIIRLFAKYKNIETAIRENYFFFVIQGSPIISLEF